MKYYKIIAIVIGAIAGYFYWHFWACTNGCAITSKWYLSTLWGAAFMYLLSDAVIEFLNNKKANNQKLKEE